jgi:hypothetical protein
MKMKKSASGHSPNETSKTVTILLWVGGFMLVAFVAAMVLYAYWPDISASFSNDDRTVETTKGKLADENAVILPDSLSGGPVFGHRDSKIVLGPAPSQAELETFIKPLGVKTMISALDGADPESAKLIASEEAFCAANDIAYQNVQVVVTDNGITGLPALSAAISSASGIVYAHSLSNDAVFWTIDGGLRSGQTPVFEAALPPAFDARGFYRVHGGLFLATDSSMDETLSSFGITERLDIKAGANEPIARTATNVTTQANKTPGVFFVYGFTSEGQMTVVGRAVKNRIYGLDAADKPRKAGGRTVETVTKKLFVGDAPSAEEMASFGALGLRTMILVEDPKSPNPALKERLKASSAENGFDFVATESVDGYIALIAEQAAKDANPCYVIAPLEDHYKIADRLSSKVL